MEDGLPEEERVPPLQGQGRRRATTTSPPWRRCSPAASPPTWPSATSRSASGRGTLLLPAAAAAGRRRQGPAGRGRAGVRRARPRRGDPGGVAGQAVRGGLRPRARPTRSAIPRQSEALYLLQRIRDEAHRFAITFHRELRGKRMTTSVLDDIPGLGPTRRKRLVKELGGRRRACARRRLDDARRRCRGCPTPVAEAVYAQAPPAGTQRPCRVDADGPVGGPRRLVAGRASPTAPTRSTPSRSCRWPPSSWPARDARARRRLRRGPDRPAGP